MTPTHCSIGIDLGGTRLRGGLLLPDGTLTARVEMPTDASAGPAHVLGNIKRLVAELREQAPVAVAGIGIAAAGQIHPRTQAVVYAPNLDWSDVPLRDEIARDACLRTWVENDVRAAAWGEYRFGAGRGSHSLLVVFVGTGVGSGAVIEGRLLRGAGNAAGEVGHTQVVIDGPACPCGQHGCLELFASGSGFIRRLEAARASGTATSLLELTGGDPARLTAPEVARAARAGDALAGEMWADAERYLGFALANYVTVLNPETLVLGGGVIASVPALADTVAASVRARATVLARAVDVTRPALGDAAGLYGAAALAQEAE